jgi:photosystem II stability/assembly factor-like uncharacterized protein
MRSFSLGLLVLLAACLPAGAGEVRHYDDSALRAVQFLDDKEGWAAGDDGLVLHTIDGGKNWERQSSGVRASLRSIQFVTPWVGWVAGGEELPGGGSAGVVLYTRDGGVAWRRLLVNSLPGLHLVRFVDEKTGYLAGDGSEQFPSGVFATTDSGKTWAPLPGPRASSWRAGDFNREGGALAGAWNRLATVRRAQVFTVDMDTLGGRTLCGLQLRGDGGVAVGQGGLVLLSSKGRGASWHYADLHLPAEAQAAWDFHAVGGSGPHVWAVGRPGSAALHSPDGGKSWEVVRTGQAMPLHALFFRDEKRGWMVGELGTVVATSDGGKTWQVQRRGGQQAAILAVHARPAGLPLDALSLLGERDGYLTAGLVVASPEPASADLARVGEACRCVEAQRLVGGAIGEALWQFPVGSHLRRAGRDELLAAWNRLHGDRAAEQLLRQVVLAIRTYRPEVMLTDSPDSDSSADSLTAEAVKEAFRQAADPAVFPEHLSVLGLAAHRAKKLYGLCPRGESAQVHHDLTAVSVRLGGTAREHAEAGAALLSGEHPPAQRHYRLLADFLEGAAMHRELMQGVSLAEGGMARRLLPAREELSPEALKAVRARANLWAIAEAPPSELTSPERLLANIGPTLADMPDDAGARVALGLGNLYARKGQWTLARETFLLLTERYPTHPLAIQAYRWLLAHQSSSEARRRHEMGQFLVVDHITGGVPGTVEKPLDLTPKKGDGKGKRKPAEVPTFATRHDRDVGYFQGKEDARRWYQGCLTLEKKLSAFGPLYAQDPAIQFCVQAARRHVGEVEPALRWYRGFAAEAQAGAWRSCAQAELWLANRSGAPPKPVLVCRPALARPYLDGHLDDPCWSGVRPVPLQNASGETAALYPTAVQMTHDRDFLYVAVRCGHPAGQGAEAAQVKTRDVDLRHDRVSILLDLDRDYATCFHLQVDQTGCIVEDCWGDRTWNPRWYVAIHREATAWTAEIAIPREALTGDLITAGNAWAANVVRVLPGRGVQAFSLPAEAPESALRGEGLGLLLFLPDAERAAGHPRGAPAAR